MSEFLDKSNVVVTAVEEAEVQTHPRAARGISNHAFTIVLMVVFFLVMMACLTAGVSIYRSVSAMQEQSNLLHLESGLMTNIVRMSDSTDTIATMAGPEGDALILVEHLESGTYETRIYHYEGSVVQEYAIAGRELNPQNAIEITPSGTFEFEYADGLLAIATDDGVFHVALRSAQEGSAAVTSAGFAGVAGAAGTAGAVNPSATEENPATASGESAGEEQ